ncbi:hypothetical protein [Pseudooceanicola sp.]|uniref:hypothetical protein n=1 Tax=Pseudooceanicola sp. TaxID=1914328 RepID=UPI0026054ABF|nr:hypothetical protein [Pseudooceanicola sp.]MDF1855666.1 hypothetical protein [Pseudooceanicola sp.]
MTMLRHTLLVLALTALPAGCAVLRPDRGGEGPVAVRDGDGQTRPRARPGSADAAAPDATDVAAAKPVAGPGGRLGVTIASLGDVGQPGLWLKTPLVAADRKGRLAYKGQRVDVDLIAIPGTAKAGSRMSLAAFQALGAPITGLPEIEVFAN